jgi:methane monooxygenase PmoA-like
MNERELTVGGVPVATYVADPELDVRLGPRPYLHPVRTLGGTVVTDAFPRDHPWHLGVSVSMPDVAGANLWGGRTYVRDEGYVWREDHGRIRPESRPPAARSGAVAGWSDGPPAADGFAERLLWCDGDGRTLLREDRTVTARAAARGWELALRYTLTTAQPRSVALGSPATNGRPGGAGYGGFFWRATAGPAVAFVPSGGDPHGSADPWLALTVAGAYTLVFRGLAGSDRWFVRTDDYVGVCAALAFEHPLEVAPGAEVARDLRVLVADGALRPDEIRAALE